MRCFGFLRCPANLARTIHYSGEPAPRYGFFSRAVRWRPHAKKVATGGEDAYLASDFVIGVADGVGWWKHSAGVDAGEYSEALMKHAYAFAVDEYQGENCVPVGEMLQRAYEETAESGVQGSTTVTMASLCEDKLEVSSLGDCTLLVVRGGEIVFRTEEQQHELNFPFQLGTGCKDTPADANRAILTVESGDLVVLGSDGLFDNVYEEEILRMINERAEAVAQQSTILADETIRSYIQKQPEPVNSHHPRVPFGSWHRTVQNHHGNVHTVSRLVTKTLNEAADEIVAVAYENSHDIHAVTPFAAKCIEGGAFHEGGKEDDITLVLAAIGPDTIHLGERFASEASVSGEMAPPYKNWP